MKKEITYSNHSTDAYSNQVNMQAIIYVDNEDVGYVDYVLYNDELTVSDIQIKPKFRRQGFGSLLMKYIQQENLEYEYKESMKTDSGKLFKPKFVSESLNDFFKPKSEEEIISILKSLYKYKDLKQDLNGLPSLEKYFEDFSFLKEKWFGNSIINVFDDEKWKSIDFTKKATKIILDISKKLNGNLKAVQTRIGTQGKGLLSFLYKLNELQSKIYHDDNSHIFNYVYKGSDYAYVGDKNGFGLFILPENFLSTFIGVNKEVIK